MKKFLKGNHNNHLYQHYQQPSSITSSSSSSTSSSSRFQYQYQQNQQQYNNQQQRYKYCRYIAYILLVLILLSCYYIYLAELYLVDLTLEGDILREPNNNEQTTIRVSSKPSSISLPSSLSLLSSSLPEIVSLKKFVSHYSLCPCVKEIQILWPYDSIPDANDFTYAHTHSRVIFEATSSSISNIDTNSVTLLDIDVFVSCSDLAFTINVWRSANDSIVGYYPKLHSINANTNSINGILSWPYVWWYESYSIISSSAAIISTKYINEIYRSSKYLDFVKTTPECESSSSLLSLWISSININDPKPPVWVSDVSISTSSHSNNDNSNSNNCIAKIVSTTGIKSMGIKSIPISKHHATQAKKFWTWQ